MRTTSLFACLFLVACGSDGGTNMNMGDDTQPMPDGGDIAPPARGFQIVSPDITIPGLTEVTYCYYFRTPNTEPMAVNKWVSHMTDGSHHLILFTTGNTDKMPPGTISAANCGFGASGSGIPSWVYSAQNADASIALPSDDGTGKPLAMEIAPNTAGFIQMHYFNPSEDDIVAHVTINAEALAADAAFTKTAAYITYNNRIKIPAGATNFVVDQQCTPPSGAKFWLMSTHAHKQAIKTEVADCPAYTEQDPQASHCPPAQSTTVFTSNDWEHPGAETWMSAPFLTFSQRITYRCTYNNPTNREIKSGDSAATDEMCMASGYYFPATKPLICFDGLGNF